MVHLNGLAGFEQTGRLERPTIERMARLVDALGHPQRAYPVIRLTRTSEKGSTAAMTASLLRGQRLGLGTYTSAALKRSAGVLP
jgi:dihydrofolate synthase/folylpolyglutamate synthase